MSHLWCRSLATTTGAHTHAQADLAARLREQLAPLPESRSTCQLLGFIYARAEVAQRHVELDFETIDARADWGRVVNEATLSLGRRTLAALGDDDVAELGGFVVVSTSWSGFPSLSRVLQNELKLPLDAVCYDLSGLGCAGPTQGVHFASQLARDTHKPVLLLFVDVMGTHGQCRRWQALPEVSEVVAHCLASDGAAAMVIGHEPGDTPVFGFERSQLRSRLWPESIGENDFNSSADGQPYLSVGKAIRTRLREETADFFSENVREGQLFLHPGGIVLMKAVAEAYPDLDESVGLSTDILREHGNLGSASVAFVLREAVRRGTPFAPTIHLFALGPGIVTTMLTLEGVR